MRRRGSKLKQTVFIKQKRRHNSGTQEEIQIWACHTRGKTRSMGAHGEQNTHRQSIFLTYRPPPGRRVPAPKKQQKEGWVGSREEAQEEDGHLGGGRQTESREVTKEGGARVDQTETGGAWSWRCQVGPRPQP